jgi:ribonuclease Z
VNSLRVIAPELPFEIRFRELEGSEMSFEFDDMPDFIMTAFRVNHNVTCYGYDFRLSRKGRFNVENAEKLNIPKPFWGKLQNGMTVTLEDGTNITPDMVMGQSRTGIHLTYTTDTRPTNSIVTHAEGADLFICEGMYGEPDKKAKAREKKHMTFYEAADMARRANVKEMWLTHYSPSLVNPKEYMKETREIFENTVAARDGRMVTLSYPEE